MSFAVSDPQISSVTMAEAPGRESRGWVVRKIWVLHFLIFVVGATFGIVGGRIIFRQSAAADRMLPQSALMLKAGPWGALAKVPLMLSAPEELLPIRMME